VLCEGEQVERHARVPRCRRMLATLRMQPRLRPVHAREHHRIAVIELVEDAGEQERRLAELHEVDRCVREQHGEAQGRRRVVPRLRLAQAAPEKRHGGLDLPAPRVCTAQ
jgi:hypothetical protein